MTTDRRTIVTPNASAVISSVLLGGVVFGMLDAGDAPVVTAGTAATSDLA